MFRTVSTLLAMTLAVGCSAPEEDPISHLRGHGDPDINSFRGEYRLVTEFRLSSDETALGAEILATAENPTAAIYERLERIFPQAAQPVVGDVLDTVLGPAVDSVLANAMANLTRAALVFDVASEFRVQSERVAIHRPIAVEVELDGQEWSFEPEGYVEYQRLDLRYEGDRVFLGDHEFDIPYHTMLLAVLDGPVATAMRDDAADFRDGLGSVVDCTRLARELALIGDFAPIEDEVRDSCSAALDFFADDVRKLVAGNGGIVAPSFYGHAVLDDQDGDRRVDGFRGLWQVDVFGNQTTADFSGDR